MKRAPHRKSRYLFSLIPAVLFSVPCAVEAAFIAGLDGVGSASTINGQGITPLGASGLLGWTDVLSNARFFEAGGDGSMIAMTPYDNYTVRYSPSTPVAVQPNTQYSLTFNMGYVAGIAGGNSGYDFSIGTIVAGNYIPLQNLTGTTPYPGNMHSVSSQVVPATLTWTTGAIAPAGDLAVQWGQVSTLGPGSSDFYGFNLVTLDATAVPEPSAAILTAGVVALAWRRRRSASGSSV